MAKRNVLQHRNSTPVLLTGALLLILTAIAIVVAFFFVSWVQGFLARPGALPGLPNSTGPSENVKYEFGQVLPSWTGQDRITVLLLGIDERAQESGPWRTDTMMLLTIDPLTKQAGVLSIPRDLWVPIPGYSDGRINTAHFLGDLYGHVGGGPALARETVEYNLGVPIHYHMRVNFQGFVSMVDLIGGVDIYVEETLNDPTYPDYNYGYDPFYIEAGWHHIDGETTLKYARTRYGSSDFERANRQQQVLLAILNRVTSAELLPDLARNASKIYDTIDTSMQTDMALDQMLSLANLAMEVDRSQIRFGVIGNACTQSWTTPDGAQVEVPLRDCMREVRDYVFFEDQPTAVPGDAQQPVAPNATAIPPEVATVSVLNGTAQGGLAGITAEHFKASGLDVPNVGNADRQDYATSLVIMNRDKPVTAARLAELMQLPASAITYGSDPNAAYDIVVVLGADYAGPPQN